MVITVIEKSKMLTTTLSRPENISLATPKERIDYTVVSTNAPPPPPQCKLIKFLLLGCIILQKIL